jgi:excisionase family DNA binding protein
MTATTLDDLPLVLTVSEASRVMRVGPRLVRRAIDRHELYAAKIGRTIRIPRASVERWLEGASHAQPELSVVEGGRSGGRRA